MSNVNPSKEFRRKSSSKAFNNHDELDNFIQSVLNKYIHVEPDDLLYESAGVYSKYLISNKSTIPDLVIYNKKFNKNECFYGADERVTNLFPRVKFMLPNKGDKGDRNGKYDKAEKSDKVAPKSIAIDSNTKEDQAGEKGEDRSDENKNVSQTDDKEEDEDELALQKLLQKSEKIEEMFSKKDEVETNNRDIGKDKYNKFADEDYQVDHMQENLNSHDDDFNKALVYSNIKSILPDYPDDQEESPQYSHPTNKNKKTTYESRDLHVENTFNIDIVHDKLKQVNITTSPSHIVDSHLNKVHPIPVPGVVPGPMPIPMPMPIHPPPNNNNFTHMPSNFLEDPVAIVSKNFLKKGWFLMTGNSKILASFTSVQLLSFLEDEIKTGSKFENVWITDYDTDMYFTVQNLHEILKESVPKLVQNSQRNIQFLQSVQMNNRMMNGNPPVQKNSNDNLMRHHSRDVIHGDFNAPMPKNNKPRSENNLGNRPKKQHQQAVEVKAEPSHFKNQNSNNNMKYENKKPVVVNQKPTIIGLAKEPKKKKKDQANL